MAAPHVTGAAALYASMNPGASPQAIRNAILASAQHTPTASLNGITVTGGRLNIGDFLDWRASATDRAQRADRPWRNTGVDQPNQSGVDRHLEQRRRIQDRALHQ